MNPQKIPKKHLPLIVFSDQTSGLFASLIKVWTKGAYNHVMWANRQGFFASQGNTYSEVEVDRYMKDNMRLKFWKIKKLTPVQKRFIIESINEKLKLPWYKKMYDWLGIIGQTIKIKFISTPGLDYCSEDVPQHLIEIMPYVDEDFAECLANLPKHAAPSELNKYFKKNKNHFEVYGTWDGDKESS